MGATELFGWEVVGELLEHSTPELLFGERLQALNTLLPSVQFPLLAYHLLEKVREGISYVVEFGSARPGTDQNFKELRYICDGDSNGVLHFAGTSYGEHQWINPVLAKRVNITASSRASRYTDPKALVSRTYQGTSVAGPRMEDRNTCAWWMVAIGQDHKLMCNYYTLRQEGSRAYIRFWNFQGSMDRKTWTSLRVHENDQTMCKPDQFASWPITGPCGLLPFRFFRVLLTGSTADAANLYNLCICFLELYGYFH